MSTGFSMTLVINTYEQPEYLQRVLRAVEHQTRLPEEIVLADDGSSDATREVFNRWSADRPFRSLHVWQKHEDFRRSRILNQAIAQSRSHYLVFLDGDTVPHPRFVDDHATLAALGFFVQGHRALVERQGAEYFGKGEFAADRGRALRTRQLSGLKHAFRWPILWKRRRSDLHGVRGCNLAIWRDDLIAVNGYNEAFVGWGREDSELALRLMNRGVTRLDVRGRALCYHLWHPPANRASLANNDQLLAAAREEKATRCQLGVGQYLTA
jgi:glycosyltransferase involved in cell wall biosynthesis